MREKKTNTVCGHLDRPHHAKGRCKICAKKTWDAENREHIKAYNCGKYAANSSYYRAYYVANKEKHGALAKAWRNANQDKMYVYLRKHNGVGDPERSLAVRKQSGGICTICWCQCDENNKICADHNHKTGWTRSAICNRCNTIVGAIENGFTDKPYLEHRAYIKFWQEEHTKRGVT